MVEFLACAKRHGDKNVCLDVPEMKISPQMSEHRLRFKLMNLIDNGEAFLVIIWNMYSILNILKINYHFLQSPLKPVFSQQHSGFS